MLKKSILIFSLFLSLSTYEKNICMEKTDNDENRAISEISLLEAQPKEILREIVASLFSSNKDQHCIHSAQLIWNQTAGLRRTNHYFNQIIEELIVTYCSCELAKLSLAEKYRLLLNLNSKNELGWLLILISLAEINPQKAISSHEYITLKKCFHEKIIQISNSCFHYNFENVSASCIFNLLFIIETAFRHLRKNNKTCKSFTFGKFSATYFTFFQALLKYGRKSELKRFIFYLYHRYKMDAFSCNHFTRLMIKHYLNKETFFFQTKNLTIGEITPLPGDECFNLDPLKLALIFDDEMTVIKILKILDSKKLIKSNIAPRYLGLEYHYALELLNYLYFASCVATPGILTHLLQAFCNWTNLFSMMNINNYKDHPAHEKGIPDILNAAFNAGNEENFLLLLHYGFDIKTWNPQFFHKDKMTPLFQQLFENINDPFEIRKIIKNEIIARQLNGNVGPLTTSNEDQATAFAPLISNPSHQDTEAVILSAASLQNTPTLKSKHASPIAIEFNPSKKNVTIPQKYKRTQRKKTQTNFNQLRYSKLMICGLGTLVIGFIAYQFFKGDSSSFKLAQLKDNLAK